jgi:hypothetical protein
MRFWQKVAIQDEQRECLSDQVLSRVSCRLSVTHLWSERVGHPLHDLVPLSHDDLLMPKSVHTLLTGAVAAEHTWWGWQKRVVIRGTREGDEGNISCRENSHLKRSTRSRA